MGAPHESIDEEIGHWLTRLRDYFGVDRVAVAQLSAHTPRLHITQTGDRAPGARRPATTMVGTMTSWEAGWHD